MNLYNTRIKCVAKLERIVSYPETTIGRSDNGTRI